MRVELVEDEDNVGCVYVGAEPVQVARDELRVRPSIWAVPDIMLMVRVRAQLFVAPLSLSFGVQNQRDIWHSKANQEKYNSCLD